MASFRERERERGLPSALFAWFFGILQVMAASGAFAWTEPSFGRQVESYASSDVRSAAGRAGPSGPTPKGGSTGYRLVDWALETFVDGANVTLGVGGRRSSFTVTRKSDRAAGTIVDRDYPALFFVYSTKPMLFPDSNVGYSLMFRLSSFRMDQQIATGNPVTGIAADASSNVSGIIGYLVPSITYQWGEQYPAGTYFLVGMGAGLVTTTYGGTMTLRTASGAEQVDVRDKSYSLNLAWGAFLEARWRHIGVSLSLMRAQMPGSTYDTTFEDASLYVGYRIFF